MPINASITMTEYGWGTRIDMACSYGDWGESGNTPAQSLGMVVVGRDGSHTQVATWLGLSGATALPRARPRCRRKKSLRCNWFHPTTDKVLLEKNL